CSSDLVKVNDMFVRSGDASAWIDLQVGVNVITVEVTAQNGDVLIYTVTVHREPDSSNEVPDPPGGGDEDHEESPSDTAPSHQEPDDGELEQTVPVLLNGVEQGNMFDVTTYERDGREGTIITIRPEALSDLNQQIDI